MTQPKNHTGVILRDLMLIETGYPQRSSWRRSDFLTCTYIEQRDPRGGKPGGRRRG